MNVKNKAKTTINETYRLDKNLQFCDHENDHDDSDSKKKNASESAITVTQQSNKQRNGNTKNHC